MLAGIPSLELLEGNGSIFAGNALTDPEGRFQLRVADRGYYFLLAISAHVSQDDREQAKTTLAQIGRFFRLTPEMFEAVFARARGLIG